MKGYYICKCNEEFVSDFPYNKVTCLQCGNEMKIDREITEIEEEQIKDKWLSQIMLKRKGITR